MTSEIERFEKKFIPEPNSGCWLWIGATYTAGYGRLFWGRKQIKASRVAYRLYRGPIPSGLFVCHHCDTPACVNPEHLFLGTSEENFADMRRKQRNPRGERQGRSKLTNDLVVAILADNRPDTEIAAEIGVSAVLIGKVRRRELWRHVPGAMRPTVRKISDDQVRDIRALKGNGERQVDIGRRYGVSQRYISLIMRGELR